MCVEEGRIKTSASEESTLILSHQYYLQFVKQDQ